MTLDTHIYFSCIVLVCCNPLVAVGHAKNKLQSASRVQRKLLSHGEQMMQKKKNIRIEIGNKIKLCGTLDSMGSKTRQRVFQVSLHKCIISAHMAWSLLNVQCGSVHSDLINHQQRIRWAVFVYWLL